MSCASTAAEIARGLSITRGSECHLGSDLDVVLTLTHHFLGVGRHVTPAALLRAMAATAKSSKKVGWLSYSIQHFLCLDGMVRAVVLHRALEVCRHHSHHY